MKPRRIIELIIALLTVIGSFLGGQAAAQNNVVDIFKTQKIENHE